MADFIMIMKGRSTSGSWEDYIEKLLATGKFRGGSAFGNGQNFGSTQTDSGCIATGFMRFEANSVEEISLLVPDNPVYKAGGEIELHELVVE